MRTLQALLVTVVLAAVGSAGAPTSMANAQAAATHMAPHEGQVGRQVDAEARKPRPIRWRQLTPGATTCGIDTDGIGWCWGENDSGQVGDGTRSDRLTPHRLPGDWRSIETRTRTTCGVQTNGTGWCWGRNYSGSVGNGSTADALTPVRLVGEWSAIQPGDTVVGVETTGNGWTWGTGEPRDQEDGGDERVLRPRILAGSWLSIADSCGIQVDLSAWCWGDNDFGQVGNDSDQYQTEPVRLRTPGRNDAEWRSLDADGSTRCGLLVDGTGYCWGSNRNAGVGWPDSRDRWAPYRLEGTWRFLQTEGRTTCGVRTDDSAWCWGDNEDGQVGNGTQTARAVPFRLAGTWESLVLGSAGARVCGIRKDRSGWCWGWNPTGEVGNGRAGENQLTPSRLSGSWRSLTNTGESCGVRTDGSGWCWGGNDEGAVGNGTGLPQLSPYRLAGTWDTLTSMGFAGSLTCGLRPDRSGWCWGVNSHGTVGDGSTTDRLSPFRLDRPRAATGARLRAQIRPERVIAGRTRTTVVVTGKLDGGGPLGGEVVVRVSDRRPRTVDLRRGRAVLRLAPFNSPGRKVVVVRRAGDGDAGPVRTRASFRVLR